MPRSDVSRRQAMQALGAALTLPALPAFAKAALDLEWYQLVPQEQGETMERLRQLGVVQHGQMSSAFTQQTEAQLTREFDGMLVRLPGYIVPLDFQGTGVTSFLLVPYVGACIHVPPPPPNQLVFVTTETPYEAQGLFEPVNVTGIFGTGATSTQLAEVGYSITAEKVVPYVPPAPSATPDR